MPVGGGPRDAELLVAIGRVYTQYHEVYGAKKVWRQLRREDFVVARCTVARLMHSAGLRGVVRGATVRTTRPGDRGAATLPDLVQRQFTAERPNQLWVADFTYVATWRGFVYVAFVIDAFALRIVGWRAHTRMQPDLVLDALEQALHDREQDGRLVVHSDRGSQYIALRFTERLAEKGAAPSLGSVGDAGQVGNRPVQDRGDLSARALEGLRRCGVRHAQCVAWFNQQRLLEPLSDVRPAEFEERYYREQQEGQNLQPPQTTPTGVGVIN